MAALENVKTALRIRHSELDDLLTSQIYTARAEMVRAGVPQSVAYDDENLLTNDAITTFCQMRNADTITESETYTQSWKYQLDCLRKSSFDVPGGG